MLCSQHVSKTHLEPSMSMKSVGAKSAWMNMSKWNQAQARLSLDELQGHPCYIGLDLATKIDMVAKIMIFPPYGGDPNYHVHGKYYIPEARLYEEGEVNSERYQEWDKLGLLTVTDGEVIQFSVIEDDIGDDMVTHDVQEVAFDPWQAAQLAQNMENDGVTMVEIRHTVQMISEPMKEMEALVLSQRWAHGDCPIMTWMISNVTATLDKKDNIYPNKERAENKIDGPVAGIMALARATVHDHDAGNLNDFLMGPNYRMSTLNDSNWWSRFRGSWRNESRLDKGNLLFLLRVAALLAVIASAQTRQ